MLDQIWAAVQPQVAELLAMVLVALFGWVAMMVRRHLGLKAEALMRDALHRALETGVNATGKEFIDDVAVEAVAWAKKSVPDAIKGLRASDEKLIQLALAKARAAIGPVREGR